MIAIHDDWDGFAPRWIEYCKKQSIPYKLVSAYDSDIVEQLTDCNAFLWHHHHAKYKDALFAKQLLYSLQISGKKVFPDFNTTWHFDDKLSQKYLLESINAPFIPTSVFYQKDEAIEWINKCKFPKVFKLRGGASSENVILVKDKHHALSLVNRAFGEGFKPYNHLLQSKEQYRKYKQEKATLRQVFRPFYYLINPPNFLKLRSLEKGYVYFQDYVPDNTYDIRVIVIGDKAFGIKRIVRAGDFRASGSGNIIYNKDEIDEICVRISFEVNRKIKSQCTAFDYVFDKDKPKITEISYAFLSRGYDNCPGYWDSNMIWYEKKFNPYGWIIENLMNE